jgi:hypothetical protein
VFAIFLVLAEEIIRKQNNDKENSIHGGYKASGYSGLRKDLLT